MKTLGIDPGTAIMGYGVVEESGEKLQVVGYGCFRTDKSETPSNRLLKLSLMLEEIFDKHKPDFLAVEKLFFCSNSKTVMAVGEARGVVLLAAARFGIKVAEYTPLQVKMALTGYGRAEKRQVQQMVQRVLKLKELPRPDDAADALAIAVCHLHSHSIDSARDKSL